MQAQQEFERLFFKNHYPVLKDQMIASSSGKSSAASRSSTPTGTSRSRESSRPADVYAVLDRPDRADRAAEP